ncbi:MAG TPA: ABC transporter substrate-binding protein [Stellaceae bacterium]|nr:ABC transporter substrate-binding protein [Stellaceae bacterium]
MKATARLLAGAVLLLAAARAQALDTAMVGWAPSTPMAPALIAVDKGYFETLGIKPDLDAIRGTMDALPALATGRLDVVLGGVTAGVLNAIASGLDLRVVAPLSIQPPAPSSTPLVARKDLWDAGTIRSAADLRGRKVAVNGSGNGIDYRLSLILETAGMTLKDVDLTKINFPEMVTALASRGIDAGMVTEPYASVAIQQETGVVMMKESGAGAGEVTTFVLFSGKFIRERRAVAVRFLEGVRQGMLDLAGEKWRSPENAAIVAKYLKMDPATYIASGIPGFDPTLDIARCADSIRQQEAMHRKNGFLQYPNPLAPAQMFDASLAKEAVK